jgi:hypothetical protein
MKRDRPETAAVDPHVFDQTNGVVDLGVTEPAHIERGKPDTRSVAGIAMLSTQRP